MMLSFASSLYSNTSNITHEKFKFYRRVPLLFLIYSIVYSYMLNKQLVSNYVKNCSKTPSIITVKLKKYQKKKFFSYPDIPVYILRRN